MGFIERFSAPLLFFLLAAFAAILSVSKPYHNWDIIGYIASAKSFEQKNIESVHSFTYEQLRNSLSAEEYERLAQENGSGYRHSISTSPSAFREQLPFYQIRPVYTGMIYLLYKTGVDIGFATHLISGIAVVVGIAFLYVMSAPLLEKPFMYALPPLAVLFGVLDLARLSTPDAFAFLAVIVSVYLYLKARIKLLLIFLPIVLGVRSDFVLFTMPLLFFVFLLDQSNRGKAMLSIFASVAVYFGIGAYFGNPGWSTTFYSSLVQKLAHPISAPPILTARDYFYALLNGVKGVLEFNKSLILFILMTAYSLYLIKFHAKATSFVIAFKSNLAVLAVVCFVFVGTHFLAFPVAFGDRFFSAPYLLGAFSLLAMMTDYLKASKSPSRIL